jgi:hypothetical protein
MKRFMILVALLASVHAARAQETPSPSVTDRFKNLLPTDLGIASAFNAMTQQVFDTLPILEGLGFEVVMFKVQWGIPPISKLVLRSKGTMDAAELEAIATRTTAAAAY